MTYVRFGRRLSSTTDLVFRFVGLLQGGWTPHLPLTETLSPNWGRTDPAGAEPGAVQCRRTGSRRRFPPISGSIRHTHHSHHPVEEHDFWVNHPGPVEDLVFNHGAIELNERGRGCGRSKALHRRPICCGRSAFCVPRATKDEHEFASSQR